MNKLLLTLGGLLLISGANNLFAYKVSVINLTDKTKNYTYLKSKIIGGWSRETIKNIAPHSKAENDVNRLHMVCYSYLGYACKPLKTTSGDHTIILRKNGDTDVIDKNTIQVK